MATVTGLTAARMLEIEAASVVDGEINGTGHLILTKHDGTQIDAGSALVAVPNASMNQQGIVELATDAETITGTDITRAITPSNLTAVIEPIDERVTTLENAPPTPPEPPASDTQAGVVELATSVETSALADATRAVTPASLAPTVNGLNAIDTGLDSRLDVLEAEPGERVQILATGSFAETDPVTSYPQGISMMSVGSSHGWSLNSSFGSVVTYHIDNSRAYQKFNAHQSIDSWIRYYYQTDGWSAWTPVTGNVITTQLTITPVANTPTSVTWNFGKTLPTPVRTIASAHTTVPGSVVHTVATSSATTTSVIVWVYRTNTTATLVNVMATGGL